METTKRFQLSDNRIMQTPSKKLMDILMNKTEKITVCLKSGKEIGQVPLICLNGYKYFDVLFYGNFAKVNKITLLDDYTEEMGLFFIEVIVNIYFNNIAFTNKELVWFCALADDYEMDDELFAFYFNKLNTWGNECKLDLAIFNELVKIANGKFVSPKLNQLMEKTKANITTDFEIRDIKSETLTYSIGRNFICKLLSTYNFQESETEIFKLVIEKVIEVNNNPIGLSLKGLYDLLVCIKWFNVRKTVVMDYIPKLQIIYPTFEITKNMQYGLDLRKTLVDSYNKTENIKDTFKFIEEKHANLNVRKYGNNIQTFKDFTHVTVYTTSTTPMVTSFSIKTKTPKVTRRSFTSNAMGTTPYIKISPLTTNNKMLSAQLTISYNDKDGQLAQINKSWLFSKDLMVQIPDVSNIDDTNFKITFNKLYFINDNTEHS